MIIHDLTQLYHSTFHPSREPGALSLQNVESSRSYQGYHTGTYQTGCDEEA